MFKTKGFSSNNSLKRRGIIVDAPDLPPEECEFFITGAGVADTEKMEIPDSKTSVKQPIVDFKVEELYEDNDNSVTQEQEKSEEQISLIKVKGIGKGTVDNLETQGINTIVDLLAANPDTLSANVSGASSKTILEWQSSARKLLKVKI